MILLEQLSAQYFGSLYFAVGFIEGVSEERELTRSK